jgi:hypothetical protein
MKRGGKEKIGEINPLPVHVDVFFHSCGMIGRFLYLLHYCLHYFDVLLFIDFFLPLVDEEQAVA